MSENTLNMWNLYLYVKKKTAGSCTTYETLVQLYNTFNSHYIYTVVMPGFLHSRMLHIKQLYCHLSLS